MHFRKERLDQKNKLSHKIITANPTPITSPYFSPQLDDELKKQIEKIFKKGIIQKSTSNWCSPILLIPKKMETGDYMLTLES